MAAMDLRTNQEVMGMQSRYSTEYGGHMFAGKETFEEADIKGNNNIFNSLKTEANSNHSHDDSSLYQGKCSNKMTLEVDDSMFSYSSFKKAMDLRTHNRTLDGGRRTIFEDAEYFAKTHCYKLLPITFEQVDETIIQSEHNYSLFSLTSESEPEEDCSRMMDYSQIKEKNYKRRRTKFREGSEECADVGGDGCYGAAQPSPVSSERNDSLSLDHGTSPVSSERNDSLSLDHGTSPPENSTAVQPLDLSGGHQTEGEKTDLCLRERSDNSAEKNEEVARLDSDKENLDVEVTGIRVTITRPDEKENYEPCDLFLNDIARLVPWLIDKDCFEVDILDRTCDGNDEFRKHRLYYVIPESTWRLFQTSNERVILTNDRSLAPPALRKAEKGERPSFLVFDQLSLAKCLAEYCQEIGGCFEYTCVEEGKDEERPKEVKVDGAQDVEVTGKAEVKEVEDVKISVEAVDEGKEIDKEISVKEEVKETEELMKKLENAGEELQTVTEEKTVASEVVVVLSKETEKPEAETEMPKQASVQRLVEEALSKNPVVVEITAGMQTRGLKQLRSPVSTRSKDGRGKTQAGETKQGKGTNPKKPPIQPKPKNSQVTTRSKSTSESETSQKSDERVSSSRKEGRKRGGPALLSKIEPPAKVKKSTTPEICARQTRFGKVPEDGKGKKVTTGRGESVDTRQRRQAPKGGGVVVGTGEQAEGRSLRSQNKDEGRGRGQTKGKVTTTGKPKGGRR